MSRVVIQQRTDTALNKIVAERDAVLHLPSGNDTVTHLAALFDQKADLWAELYEATSSASQARGAIRARQYARWEAARLRSRVSAQPVRAA